MVLEILKYLGVLMAVGSGVFLASALWLASEINEGRDDGT